MFYDLSAVEELLLSYRLLCYHWRRCVTSCNHTLHEMFCCLEGLHLTSLPRAINFCRFLQKSVDILLI